MNEIRPHRPGRGPGLPVLLLVGVTAVVAAQSQAWASAVATAAAVYSVIAAEQDRRSRP
ncbi:hypothetical protein ACH5A3_38930 [Streptomyces echinatus]|uniref:hypothetical protein n=1 Tax=Streptomyces echinatus TaxID=67293 RepID=UPI0037972F60